MLSRLPEYAEKLIEFAYECEEDGEDDLFERYRETIFRYTPKYGSWFIELAKEYREGFLELAKEYGEDFLEPAKKYDRIFINILIANSTYANDIIELIRHRCRFYGRSCLSCKINRKKYF